MQNDIEKELEAHVQQLIDAESSDESKPNRIIIDRKTVTCKSCKDTDTWYSRGRFPNGGKKWRDSEGLICNGRMCGACNRDRAGKTMKRMRSLT